MPSPFPGMDPYLEHPRVFFGLYFALTCVISEALQAIVPERYYADLDHRHWFELPHDEYREPYVDVMTREGERERIVTTIEVLRPSNKVPGESRMRYLQKQREALAGEVHLVEIDLLRGGRRTTIASRQNIDDRFVYHASVRYWERSANPDVYPFGLRDTLPEIAVPLLPGDAPVVLDLQPPFERSYDTGPYHRRIRNGESPIEPPLSDEDAAWAAERVQAAQNR